MNLEIPKAEPEKVVYRGRLHEIVEQEVMLDGKTKVFEIVRRPPGTRLIIITPENKLLLTREYRREKGGWDYRLPGGKVFDSLAAFDEAKSAGSDIVASAEQGARKEAREEVGINPTEMRHLHTSTCGATIDWDLYYFLVTQYEQLTEGQSLEAGEQITTVEVTLKEAARMCMDGSIQEDRSVAVLLRYLGSLS